MFRRIGKYTADFGTNENGRVTIKDGVCTVSTDMEARTPGADFEGLFYGRERINILVDNISEEGSLITDIGPMEYADETDKLNVAKAKKRAEIAAARYEDEVAGIDVGGMKVHTDRSSQAMITGAALQAIDDPDYTCHWKTETGFVPLDATILKNIAKAVRAHVQECFDKEAAAFALVDAAENEDELKDIKYSA